MSEVRQDLADLRRDYVIAPLRRADLNDDPLKQFDRWFRQALDVEAIDANAMTLTTVTPDGQPTARNVLLKSYDEDGFVFYTNLDSSKARDMAKNDRVALLLYWHELHRQVRINGRATRTASEEDRRYFSRRPRDSQLSAWASPQSQTIASRRELEERVRRETERFAGRDVELPPFWGGYRVAPSVIEFWQGRENRLHDRFQYTRTEGGGWRIERLAP